MKNKKNIKTKVKADKLYTQGNVYSRVDQHEKALEFYNKAIAIYEDARYYNNRAATYKRMNRWQEAIDDYEYLISHFPKYAKGYLSLGSTYIELIRYEDAVTVYKEFYELYKKKYFTFNPMYGGVDQSIQGKSEIETIFLTSTNYLTSEQLKLATKAFEEAVKSMDQIIKIEFENITLQKITFDHLKKQDNLAKDHTLKQKCQLAALEELIYSSYDDKQKLAEELLKWRMAVTNDNSLLFNSYYESSIDIFDIYNSDILFDFKTYVYCIINSLDEAINYVNTSFADIDNFRVVKKGNNIYSICIIFEEYKLSQLNEYMSHIQFVLFNPSFLVQDYKVYTLQCIVSELGNRISSLVYIEDINLYIMCGFKFARIIPDYDYDILIGENLVSPVSLRKFKLYFPSSSGDYERIHHATLSSSLSIQDSFLHFFREFSSCSRIVFECVEESKIYFMESNEKFDSVDTSQLKQYKLSDTSTTESRLS